MVEGTGISLYILVGIIIFGLFVGISVLFGEGILASSEDIIACVQSYVLNEPGDCMAGNEESNDLPEVRVHEIKGDTPSKRDIGYYGKEHAQWLNDRKAFIKKLEEIGVEKYSSYDRLGIGLTTSYYTNIIKDWDGNLISEREKSPYVEYVVYDDNGNATDKYVTGNKDSTVRMIFDERQLPEGNTYAMGTAMGNSSIGRYSVLKNLNGDDDGITYIYGMSHDKNTELIYEESSDRIKGYQTRRWD